ncbi:hypothetical protein Pint_36592 [Pistacia integerrima]|uniref:Uncharacterized protein n=1 Tax=Pistacia integerrima TaxID=434235 RepID=A0ACC0Y1Z6_9ROSI|nr:hypothetical protein Pint_36592 [Pistacia integerrima]
MDSVNAKRRENLTGRILVAALLATVFIIIFTTSSDFSTPNAKNSAFFVTGTDFASPRGNMGAVKILQKLFPEPGRLQFIHADLGDAKSVHKIFAENAFDAVIHFAAVAYVGESASFGAARGIIPGLKVRGTDYKTADGTCIRDYIDVTDLVDAHVLALANAKPGKLGIYNVGTGKATSHSSI